MPRRGRVAVHLHRQACWLGDPITRGAGHLFAAGSGMEWFGRNPVGSIRGSVSPQSGDHDQGRARTGLRPFRVSPRLGEAADLAVAQAVVDEGEKSAGGCHPPDLVAPPLTDASVVGPDHGVAVLAGDSLDGSPAHEA
jgi:hypothetical protein